MVSAGTVDDVDQINDESGTTVGTSGVGVMSSTPLHISTSQRGLLGHENTQKGILNTLKELAGRSRFLKYDSSHPNMSSSSDKFQRIVGDRENISRSVTWSNHGICRPLSVPFVHKVNWDSLGKLGKEWIKNPINMALLVWIICVSVSGAILFMVMVGMLNHAIPKKSQRDVWFEVNNQILNALFTLMCLYQHPQRFYHLVLLCRWRTEDILKLGKIYCKNGTNKPHVWGHMLVVVVLLHLNCFAQYALCGLNLGYRRSERSPVGVGVCISVAMGSVAAAGMYTVLSPLGKDYETDMDREEQDQLPIVDTNRNGHLRVMSPEKTFSFSLRNGSNMIEDGPTWKGGLFDIWDDIYLSYLSLFCSFCVFGWNMERLGFGNMYVHIATFVLFCSSPFWIFSLAAINIDNEAVREALGLTGIMLCFFGLLYGGFWRIQIRKRFKLPGNDFCCGTPAAVTDCAQWLFCCWCSLAQEVRTGDFYEIVENKFYIKQQNVSYKPEMSPLPREGGSVQSRLGQSSPQWGDSSPSRPAMVSSPSPSRFSEGHGSPDRQFSMVETSIKVNETVLTPPVPTLIQIQDNRPAPT